MKRILTATAITALMATGVAAATDTESVLIQKYVPNAQVDMLSDEQVEQIKQVAYGGESFSEKRNQIRALIGDEAIAEEATMVPMYEMEGERISEQEALSIQKYAPDVDPMALPEDTAAQLLTIIHSGDSESEKRNMVRALLES